MPPRSDLRIAAPMSNPPEMLLTPNPMPIQGPAPIPNQPHNYPIQDGPPIQNYPLDQHAKIPQDSQYPHFALPENIMQYSSHDPQSYSPGHPVYPQNYPNQQPQPPPPPPNYPQNYPPVQNYPPNQSYPNQPEREYVPQQGNFPPHQNYQYPSPNPPYQEYPNIPQHGNNFPRGLPPPVQESYVLTQLTESSKVNYPVQTYPIAESSFNQPDFLFSEEGKRYPPKMPETDGSVDKNEPQAEPEKEPVTEEAQSGNENDKNETPLPEPAPEGEKTEMERPVSDNI